MAAAGFPAGDDLVQHQPFTVAGGYDGAVRLLAHPAPTALFASSDAQAIGVLSACRERGLTVPARVSVVSFDGTELAPHTDPPLTVVQQPIETIAGRAMEWLLSSAEQPAAPPRHEVVATELVVRASTAPIPAHDYLG